MKITNDRKIRISRGEILQLQSSAAKLSLLGADTEAGEELSIEVPPGRSMLRLQATSAGIGSLKVTSSTGEHWTTTLFPGSNLFEFVVEPEADEWYCENDDGNPPHPVSKGDSICEYCGGKVIQGGK